MREDNMIKGKIRTRDDLVRMIQEAGILPFFTNPGTRKELK